MTRLVYLDALRAVAVFLTLGAHLPVAPTELTWGREFFVVWRRMGWVGVDLFFCLSGFLIGGLLFNEYKQRGKIELVRFYIRRAFKIWPSYALFVVVASAALVLNHKSMNLIWPNLLHVQNYFPSAYGHTWSLAVEEHFYVALPLLFAWLIQRNPGFAARPFRTLPWLFVAIALACLVIRAHAAWVHEEFDFFRNQAQTQIRVDSLFAGVVLAYAVHLVPQTVEWLYPWRAAMLLGGVTCFVPACMHNLEFTPFLYTAGYSLLWLGSMGIALWSWFASTGDPRCVRAASERPRAPKWAVRVAVVGACSYSIYLWHMPLATASAKFFWNRYLDPNNPASVLLLSIVYVSLAVLVGVIMYRIVEGPALAVRDRVFPGLAREATDQSPCATRLLNASGAIRRPGNAPSSL